MKTKPLVIFLTLSAFTTVCRSSEYARDNIESVKDELMEIERTKIHRFFGHAKLKRKKQLLDISHLHVLNATEIEFQIKPDGETTLFNAVPGIPSMKGFFHGSNGGKTLNLFENQETKAVVGSIIDSETNEIHQISTNYKGETEIITKHVDDFVDVNDETVVPASKFGLIGSRRQANSPVLPKNRSLNDPSVTIDVMVVWTKNAECANSDLHPGCELTSQTTTNILDKIQLAVDETNTAFALSGISSELRLVHAYLDATYYETDQALNDLTYTGDGLLDDVHEKRIRFGADIVSLWIDSQAGCGKGWVGPNKDYMFNVIHLSCATGYFSFGHEIGHNLGCNHDRGTEDDCSTNKPNYGYRDEHGAFRDIMSYDCESSQCDNVASTSCIRVQRFSNTVSSYEGAPIGNEQCDCASHINAYSDVVANYFPSKTEEELESLKISDVSYSTAPPTTEDCKSKGESCNADDLCCSNECKFRQCL